MYENNSVYDAMEQWSVFTYVIHILFILLNKTI